jgi:protein arginine kinase
MKNAGLDPAAGSWVFNIGESMDIILSSRVRLARNLKDFNFERKADPATQEKIIALVQQALEHTEMSGAGTFIDTKDLAPLSIQFLLERHLISPDFVQSQRPKGLFVSNDQSLSIMVNEEDHLRFQVLAAGLAFETTARRAHSIDFELDRRLSYAFSPELGYLTACPTNVGTGMRASVLIHLPALVLTREIEKVLRGVLQVGFSVRGLYGEGTETKGHFFQLSNQVTLGVTEAEIIEGLKKIARELITLEKNARHFLLKNTRLEIEDKIFRALAILKNARVMSSDEVINLTSAVRLGIGLELISEVSLPTVNEIMILTQPANLQILFGKAMESAERDEKRAEFIRNRLTKKLETK